MAPIPLSDEVSRRRFLSGLLGVVASTVATLVGLPAIAYLVSPGFKKQNQAQWLTLGPVAGLTPGRPTGFPFARKTRDGWTESMETGGAYTVTHDGQNVKAFSFGRGGLTVGGTGAILTSYHVLALLVTGVLVVSCAPAPTPTPVPPSMRPTTRGQRPRPCPTGCC